MTSGPDARRRFEALFDELYEPLQRYALRRTDPDTAQDVVSETLTTLWRRLDDVPPDAALPWAYRVAGNVLTNTRRGERRRLRLVDKIGVVDPPRHTAPGDVPDPEVHAAIETLGETDRELVRLWAWEGLGPKEIATVLELTPNAVSIRLHKAKAKLVAVLGKNSSGAGHEEGNREEVR